jgi:PPP family 3-phenylpropionic acid transporter
VLVAGVRVLLAYLVFYAALGAAYPFMPVFYRDLGLALDEIGVLIAVQAAIMLVFGPVWGGLSDRFPRSGVALPLAAAVATAGAVVLYLSFGFLAVFIGALVLFIGIAGVAPLLDARTLETLGSSARNRFGQVRAFGSLAFVVATLVVGVMLDQFGPRSLFWVYIPMLALTVVVTATIPRRGSSVSVSLRRGMAAILSVHGVPLFLLGFVVVWTALAGTNTFYSIQMAAIGGSGAQIGLIWAIGALVEVPIMYAFPRLARRFGAERLLVIGSIAFALRTGLSALATEPWQLLAIAPLEGVGFACVFVGGVTVLASRAPTGTGGTAQGLLTSGSGLATILGSTLGGIIAAAIGIPGLFVICAVVSVVGAAIIVAAIVRPAEPGPSTPAPVTPGR